MNLIAFIPKAFRQSHTVDPEAGGWPNLNLRTTLQGAPLKLRLGGAVHSSQNLSPSPTKLVPCLGD